jgi:hypothetical protein
MAQAEVLDPEERVEPADLDETQPEGDSPKEHVEDEDDSEGGTVDEVVITIGDESPPSEEEERDRQAPPWVGELRKSKREADRLIREQKAEIERLKGAGQQPQAVTVGPKPTLEACEYDEARFETEFTAWQHQKNAVEREAETKKAAAEQATKAWEAQLAHHAKLKSALKVPDFDEAEAEIETALSVTQQGLIVHGAENSAQVFYALGKNPKTLKDLAAITDPVKFAFAVAKLETKLKVTPRSTPPIPERNVRGNAPAPTGRDRKLEALEAEAAKTSDRSKVIAYKASLRKRAG